MMEERQWTRSSAVCLRLLRNQNIYQHCSLCSFLQEQQPLPQCLHSLAPPAQQDLRTATPFSDVSNCTFYTAADDAEDEPLTPIDEDPQFDARTISSRSSTSTLVESVQVDLTHTKSQPKITHAYPDWKPSGYHPSLFAMEYKPAQALRRRKSPTECSLRELNNRHAERLYSIRHQSEAQLQYVYETQIMAYLDGKHADLHKATNWRRSS